MRVTQSLFRQHLGWYFSRHWRIQGKRKIINTGAEKVLAEKGIPVCQPEDILKEKRVFQRVEIVGCYDKPIPRDETHPDWHARKLLTYKDDNVLLEGLTQAKLLTNTVEVKEGLPESIVLKDLSRDTNRLCKKVILSSHVFDAEQKRLPKVKDPARPAWNFPLSYGITQNRVNKLITSKLLQVIESTTDYNLVKERHLLQDLLFSFPFEKNGNLLQFELKGDTILTASQPLKPITSESTESFELPNIFPVKETITLPEEQIYKIRNIYPISGTIRKSHPHTLIVHYNKEEVKNLYEEAVTETQIHGRSLLKAFTVAAAYARQKYGDANVVLPKPVSIQCIQTDGRLFHFGILQLNTLDFEENRIKNVWYQTERLPLFERCTYEGGRPVLEGYNNEVVKHLYAFYNSV